MKFLLGKEPRACFQAAGQAIRTVLCFIPPSPADWMSMEKPSRRLDVTTTWEKPLVFSAAMAAFKFWEKYINVKKSSSPRSHFPLETTSLEITNYKKYNGHSRTNLLSSFGLSAPGHVGSLQDRGEDGQSLSSLELRSEGQETRVFHSQVCVQLTQNQKLGPEVGQK